VCQLELIRNLMQAGAVRKTLKNLPKTLEETYDRILQSIPEDRWEMARAALVLLAYSLRPLTLQELAEAMVVDVEEQCFDPKEHRLNDQRDLLEICSSLVTVSSGVKNDRSSKWMQEKNAIERAYHDRKELEVVQLAHFSVKEYMVLQTPKVGSRPPHFYLSDEIAHRHIAESSLVYLIDFSGGVRVDQFDFDAFPFLAYAARYWYEHWRRQLSSGEQTRVNELMRRLFASSEPNAFINFLNICNPDQTPPYSLFRSKSLDALPSPLYYTAQLGHYELCEWLLGDEGRDVNSAKGTIGTPLQIAALSGHAKVVKLLLDHGADVNALRGEYGCALQAAAFADHEHVVRMLLDHGADVNTQGGRFGSALIAACHGSRLATTKVLLDGGADINIISKYQGKALNVAAATGNTPLVRLLLQHGADINDTNDGEGSAVYAAAEKGHLDTVKMLINAGADINLISGSKCTALQAACSKDRTEHRNGYREVVEFLLKSGADCNVRGGNYGDALQACVEAGNHDSTLNTLHLLLDHGADVGYQGGVYHSAMRASVFTGNVEAAHVLLDRGAPVDDEILLLAIKNERTTVIPRLLERGVNVNAQNKDGTALHMAIKNKDLDTAMVLLQDPSIDINAKGGEHGATALYYAVGSKNHAMASLLLDRGADINAGGDSIGHCLCEAAHGGDEDMVLFLLEKGANINANGTGFYGTPLIAAIQSSRDAVAKLLISRGADVNARGGGYSEWWTRFR
jgi:ankyrin repeat protein